MSEQERAEWELAALWDAIVIPAGRGIWAGAWHIALDSHSPHWNRLAVAYPTREAAVARVRELIGLAAPPDPAPPPGTITHIPSDDPLTAIVQVTVELATPAEACEPEGGA